MRRPITASHRLVIAVAVAILTIMMQTPVSTWAREPSAGQPAGDLRARPDARTTTVQQAAPPIVETVVSLRVTQSDGTARVMIAIIGANFGAVPGTATLGSRPLAVTGPSVSWTDTRIVVAEPPTQQLAQEIIRVTTALNQTSNGVLYTYTTPPPPPPPSTLPTISELVQVRVPTSDGKSRLLISIEGTNFGATPGSVAFGTRSPAVTGPDTFWSDTRIVIAEPPRQQLAQEDVSVKTASDQTSNSVLYTYTTQAADTVAPTTTATTTPSANGATVTVALSATDAGVPTSGVKEMVYSATGAQVIAATTVPGASASFQVTTNGTTTVSYFARDKAGNVEATKTVTVEATSGRPESQLTPNVVDFGDVALGTSSTDRTVLLTNTGVVPLTLSALTVDGTAASEFAVVAPQPTLPATIQPGQTQAIMVRFSPATAGARTAHLTVTDNATGESRVTLRGMGQGREAALSPERFNFGRVLVNSTTAARTVTIFNTGLAPLTVTGAAVSGADAAAYTLQGLPTFPTTLAPGATTSFTVRFKPTANRAHTARIDVTHNGTGESGIPLNGTGVTTRPNDGAPGKPEANLTPNRATFGDVPLGTTSEPHTIVLTNTGDAPLNVNAIQMGGGQPADFKLTMPALPATLEPGTTLKFQVRFKPSAVGQHAATLTVMDDAIGDQRVNLSGRGQGPEVSLSTNRLNFGRLAVGTSLTRTVTIANTGLAPLHITSATISGAASASFTVAPGGATTVAPGATATLTVTCRPTTAGNRSASLEFADDGTGEHVVKLICVGT